MKKFITITAMRLLPNSVVKAMYMGSQIQLLRLAKQKDPQYWVELYTTLRHDEDEIPDLAARYAAECQAEFNAHLDVREMAMAAKPKLFKGYGSRASVKEYLEKSVNINRHYDSTNIKYRAILAEREKEKLREAKAAA